MFGAVLGLAVDGRAGRGRRDHRQDGARLRGPVDRHARHRAGRGATLSWTGGPDRDARLAAAGLAVRGAGWTRTTSGSARAGLPARAPGPGPTHEDADAGFVIAVDRGRYTVLVGDRRVTAVQARELGRDSVVVGDRVALVGDVSGGTGRAGPHRPGRGARTVLRRSADDSDPYERVIVANADQLVIVTALADPPPRIGLIDRCLVAAYVGGLDPLLCLTKADLAAPDELMAAYADLGDAGGGRPGAAATSARCGSGCTDRVSVLVGHSGVGKSTLVNALVPDAQPGHRRGQRGRPRPAHLVLRGRAAAARRRLGHRHPGHPLVRAGPRHRRPTCWPRSRTWPRAPRTARATARHRSAADGCRLDAYVAAGHSTPGRLESFRRLLARRAEPRAPRGACAAATAARERVLSRRAGCRRLAARARPGRVIGGSSSSDHHCTASVDPSTSTHAEGAAEHADPVEEAHRVRLDRPAGLGVPDELGVRVEQLLDPDVQAGLLLHLPDHGVDAAARRSPGRRRAASSGPCAGCGTAGSAAPGGRRRDQPVRGRPAGPPPGRHGRRPGPVSHEAADPPVDPVCRGPAAARRPGSGAAPRSRGTRPGRSSTSRSG